MLQVDPAMQERIAAGWRILAEASSVDETPREAALELLVACDILEEALRLLRDAGHFKCKTNRRKCLFNASREAIPWLDFDVADEIREVCEKILWHGNRPAAADCRRQVDAIGKQLAHWQLLPGGHAEPSAAPPQQTDTR